MDLTPRELLEFERAFAMLDYEKDGTVTTKELNHFMHKLGKKPTESELQEMINAVDTNGNGDIEFTEFLNSMTQKMCQEPNDDEVREVFRIFDKDNSGYITVDNIRVVMLDLNIQLGEEELEEMVRDADMDADGYVSYEDFFGMMTTR